MFQPDLHENIVFGFAPTVAGAISLLGFLHLTWEAIESTRQSPRIGPQQAELANFVVANPEVTQDAEPGDAERPSWSR